VTTCTITAEPPSTTKHRTEPKTPSLRRSCAKQTTHNYKQTKKNTKNNKPPQHPQKTTTSQSGESLLRKTISY
jgi:hypothetical protein